TEPDRLGGSAKAMATTSGRPRSAAPPRIGRLRDDDEAEGEDNNGDDGGGGAVSSTARARWRSTATTRVRWAGRLGAWSSASAPAARAIRALTTSVASAASAAASFTRAAT